MMTTCLIFLFTLSAMSKNNENFARQLENWSPQTLAHPRIYFPQNNANFIAERRKLVPELYDQFLSECDSLLLHPVPDFSDFSTQRHKARLMAQKFAFAYLVTKELKYAERAKKIVSQMLAWPDWVYKVHKPLTVDLGVATIANSLSICYDWLYETWTDQEKTDLEQAVINRGILPFFKVYQAKSEGWTQVDHNWRSVICGKIGTAVLAFYENLENPKAILKDCIDGVGHVLNKGGRDGGWNEGVSYWGYGIGEAVYFVEALYNVTNGDVNLYDIPFLKNTGDFGLYTNIAPKYCFNFSDCNMTPPLPWLMLLLANRMSNPIWQWYGVQHVSHEIDMLLFYNPKLEPKNPDTYPLGKWFHDINITAMKSGWEQDDLYIGVKSGQTAINHSHLDLNSFIFYAYGIPFIVDTGTWPYAHGLGFFKNEGPRWDFEALATSAHNTLLIDGQGQKYGTENYGEIINFLTESNLQWTIAEAHRAYGDLLDKFTRYFAFVDNKALVIVDDISASDVRKMEFLLHYQGQIKENQNGQFLLENENAFMDICFLKPQKQDNRTVEFINSQTSYQATSETCNETVQYISVRPLHRQQNYKFITVLVPFRQEPILKKAEILSENDNQVQITIQLNKQNFVLVFNLAEQHISIK